MSTSTLRGLIFDMDGVLVDSEPFICEAATRMFEQTYSLAVKKEDFIPFVGAGEDRFIGGVAEKYGVRQTMPRDKERTYAIYLEIIRGRLKPLPGAGLMIRSTSGTPSAADAIFIVDPSLPSSLLLSLSPSSPSLLTLSPLSLSLLSSSSRDAPRPCIGHLVQLQALILSQFPLATPDEN